MNNLIPNRGIYFTNDFDIISIHKSPLEGFEREIALKEKFPALKKYKVIERNLNKDHLKFYGNESNQSQEIFQKETKKSVESALKEIFQAKQRGGINKKWFKEFLIFLGVRRHEIANLCDPSNSHKNVFGLPRGKNQFLSTPLKKEGPYSNYIKKINDIGNFLMQLELEEPIYFPGTEKKVYNISFIGDRNFIAHFFKKTLTNSIINEDKWIFNVYETFWEEDDPIFDYTFDCFQKIIENQTFTSEELKDNIADFHKLFAMICPFQRGSAWGGEVVTDVLWLFHGYVPIPIEKGKSLDLEALTTLEIEDFRKIYPIGQKV